MHCRHNAQQLSEWNGRKICLLRRLREGTGVRPRRTLHNSPQNIKGHYRDKVSGLKCFTAGNQVIIIWHDTTKHYIYFYVVDTCLRFFTFISNFLYS